MYARKEAHVVPSGRGWDVVQAGSPTPISHHRTRKDAIDHAKDALRKAGGGEAVIHGRDGLIRNSDTIPAAR